MNVNSWKSSQEGWIYEQTMDRWTDNAKLSISALIHRNEWPWHNERWAESLLGFILKGSNIRKSENRICSTFLFLSLINPFCGLFSPLYQGWKRENKLKIDKGKMSDRDWLTLIHSPIKWGLQSSGGLNKSSPVVTAYWADRKCLWNSRAGFSIRIKIDWSQL